MNAILIRFLLFLCLMLLINRAANSQENAFAIPNALENPSESFSSMIRQRASELKAGDAEELSEDEPTEDLKNSQSNQESGSTRPEGRSKSDDSEPDADADDETDGKADDVRKDSTLGHLSQLRKPVREITLSSTGLKTDQANSPTPEDRADQLAQEKPVVMIAGLGLSPQLPQRYTIGFCHRPLYFEQPNLERCGKSCGYFQNAVSGVQFLANTIALPYHMGQQRPDCPIPSRGDCETCQSIPCDWDPLPINKCGALAEAAAIAGFTFLLL
jgi:hypothetical protein